MADELFCSGCKEEPELCTCALSSPAGFLGEVSVNGKAYRVARVRFAEPSKWRHLLNPFGDVVDQSGRRFDCARLAHRLRIFKAARRGEAVDVLCEGSQTRPSIARLGLDWPV